MNVYEKLSEVQSKLKAPKSNYNSFGKYQYRSCEDILEGAKPILKEVKAILLLNDTVEQVGERIYIKATATFIDAEKGEKIEVSASAREDENKKGMDLSQVTGSTSSYARKYALNGLFCIDDTKDSDATNTHGKEDASKTHQNGTREAEKVNKTNNSNTITEGQQKRIFAISNGNVALVKEVLLKHGYTSSKDVKKTEYETICNEITEKVG